VWTDLNGQQGLGRGRGAGLAGPLGPSGSRTHTPRPDQWPARLTSAAFLPVISAQARAEKDAATIQQNKEALQTALAVRVEKASRAFPCYTRSILTEIYLFHACYCREIDDGNARAGAGRGQGPAQEDGFDGGPHEEGQHQVQRHVRAVPGVARRARYAIVALSQPQQQEILLLCICLSFLFRLGSCIYMPRS
jgi:hypothetical protein